MKKQICSAFFMCCFFALALSQPTDAQKIGSSNEPKMTVLGAGTYVQFDVGSSPCPISLCTIPTGVDLAGTVTGTYIDGQQNYHAFYRLADGSITKFKVPESSCPLFYEPAICTEVVGITPIGTIAGGYYEGGKNIGFLRDRYAQFTKFSLPDALATFPIAVNPAGLVAGYYSPSSGPYRCFIRTLEGTYITFFVPDSVVGAPRPVAINSQEEVVGQYIDGNNVPQGFVRDSAGNLTALSPPGAKTTTPVGIDDSGRVVGFYQDSAAHYNTDPILGFIRDSKGNYATFSVSGSIDTYPSSVNSYGIVTGSYNTSLPGSSKGFYLLPDGTFGTFVVPGSTDTFPTAIGPTGEITGYFYDTSGVAHAFVWKNWIKIAASN
jgi:hypothetical protein